MIYETVVIRSFDPEGVRSCGWLLPLGCKIGLDRFRGYQYSV